MANNADGTLILDTELDNSGFEKGSQKLLSSIDNLTQKIEKIGAAMEKAFSNPEAFLQAAGNAAQQAAALSQSQVQKATQSAEAIQHAQAQVINANADAEEEVTESQHRIMSANAQAEEQILQSQNQIINVNEKAAGQIAESQGAAAHAYEQAADAQTQAMSGSANAAEQYEQAQNRVASSNEQAAQSAGTYEKELAKLQKKIDSAKQDLSAYYEEVGQLRESFEADRASANNDSQREILSQIEEQTVDRVTKKYAGKIEVLKALEAEYARVAQAAEQERSATDTPAPNNFYEVGKQAAALEEEIRQLAETAESELGDGFQAQVEGIQAKMESLRQALETLGQEQYPTDEYVELQIELKNATAELDKLRAEEEQLSNTEVDDAVWEAFIEREAEVSDRIDEIKAKMNELEESGGAQMSGVDTEEYADVAEAVNRLSGCLDSLSDSEGENQGKAVTLSGVLVGLTQALGRASEAAVNLGKKIAQITFSAVSSGAKLATSRLKTFSKKASETNIPVNKLTKSLTSLKRLLITRIKRMFISSLFNDVKTGIQRLAQFDSEFNTHMNNIRNSATQLKGNLAVTLGNIITVIEPFLTKIINLVSNAVAYLNQFFALLQRKKSYTAAKMGADDYAESANDAAKAQKKWNNELYDFDELNRQNKNDNSDSTDTTKTGIQYEEKEIDLPTSVQDWIKRLKEAWKNGDWYGVGLIIAEGLNKAMQYVDDWINNKFRPWGVKWASRIAQILNGIVDGVNWELLGKTLADGLNALLDIANTFLKEFNFLNLGVGVGRAVNSLVDNIDWKLLAETLKNGFMGLINLAYGFLSTFDGLKLGKNIGQTVKDWFDGIDWNRVGETFALKWNALLHIIEGIVTTPGIWESIGRSIGNFVKSWFSTIDINSLATIVINILNGVAAMIRSFLDQNPFEGVAQKIYTAINRVVHEVDWAALGKALSDLFMSVLGVFKEVVKNADWKGVGQAIGNFLGSIDWLGILSSVAEIIWTAFTGVLSGLMSTDGGRMFLALVAAIKGLQLAFTITQGLWTAAVQRWVLTGISPLQSMPQMISQTIPALKTVLGTMAKVVATGALAVFDGLMIAYDVKSLKEAADTYHEAQLAHNRETESALNNFAKLYREKGPEVAAEWAKTCYQIDTTGMSLDQAQKALVQQIDHYWDDTPQNMWEGFKQGWNAYFGKDGKGLLGLLGDAFTGAINGIKSLLGIHSPSTVFASIGRDLIAGLLNGIKEAWTNITTFFSTAFSNLKTGFTNTWKNIKIAAGNAWGGIKSTISEKWNGIANYVTKGWGDLKTAVGKVEWKSIGSNLVSGIQNGATSVWSKMTGAISKGWSSLREGLGKFDFKNIGSNMVSSIQSGVSSVWSRFSSTIVQAWANIRTSFGNIQWNNIGHNMVAGLMNGVNGAWSSMANTIVGYANSLISRIKSAFGIHSPSTVFAEIGENLDAGLEKGIADGQRGLLATATQIAGAVTEGMTPDSPEATLTMDSVMTGMQAVISGLSEIATTFKTIADTLIAAGGFQMPQIAAGTVVPYKTKVDTSAPDTDDSEVVKGYLMGILTEIQGLARTMQKDGNTQTIVVPVNINGRKVFEVVVDENNGAIQRDGYSPLKMR